MFRSCLMTFLMAMTPVLELRGAMPYAVANGIPFPLAFVICVVGNALPVPFIVAFIRTVFTWVKRRPKLRGFVERLETRARAKGDMVCRYSLLGLFILVAIPLPGTGAWTGSLVAGILGLRLRSSCGVIFCGILAAGIVVTAITLGVHIIIW